ncbi:discoidin domain-containing protein [Paenibacillus sp. CC-CFT747]|nr:discoidin domain-containing protein [Paenibacillus sp. CC-CFT747]
MIRFKRLCLSVVASLLPFVQVLVASAESQASAVGDPAVNLALGHPAKASSGTAANAVDGNAATVWQPAAADRQDNMNVWMYVDLGAKKHFNKVLLSLNRADNLKEYKIMVSDDAIAWTEAYVKNQGLSAAEAAVFPAVEARYVKVDFTLSKDLNVQLSELAVYSGTEQAAPDNLKRIYFVDEEGKEYPFNGEIRLLKGTAKPMTLKGELDTGEAIDLTNIAKTFLSTTPDVTIDPAGTLTANTVGAALIQAVVRVNGTDVKTGDLWAVVDDPDEFRTEEIVVNSTLTHPRMKTEIGHPALLEPGDTYPGVTVSSNVYGTISGTLLLDGETAKAVVPQTPLVKGESVKLTLPGKADKQGQYELRLKIEQAGKAPVYDSFYFTAWKEKDIPKNQSGIAFPGKKGKLVYVGDFRGNRILDFSNAGYGGGGVKLPDVKTEVTLAPGDGDDTARIQAAIDQVAQMPAGKDGFRGAVLLKKGKYEVAGTLTITAGGIVLRGEGDGEDGTLIYGTGGKARNLIEIGKNVGLTLDPASKKDITDLYVPSGARSFHVDDASAYRVGDKVVVRRVGNDRWIHEIGMDYIYNRPGGGATQWTAFNLDFDRIITAVDGNTVTVDAPIANAIERKWGGGQLYKYSDDARIEQVGVENMRVDTEFDPSVIDTVMDNGTTDPYYADELHAERFVVFNAVKNGWVRNVTGYHLSYSLVQMSRNAKWITVQDSKMYDMVSIITGADVTSSTSWAS